MASVSFFSFLLASCFLIAGAIILWRRRERIRPGRTIHTELHEAWDINWQVLVIDKTILHWRMIPLCPVCGMTIILRPSEACAPVDGASPATIARCDREKCEFETVIPLQPRDLVNHVRRDINGRLMYRYSYRLKKP